MVFQKPNPFPRSIYDNVAYGPRIHGIKNKKDLDAIVEKSLRDAAIWEEVCDRLDESAMGLSGGQQQRLCIARALAIQHDIILMDEPCSALDPIATTKIEDLIDELKKRIYSKLLLLTICKSSCKNKRLHRFMYLGEVIEFGETEQLFQKPKHELTEKYIIGRFG